MREDERRSNKMTDRDLIDGLGLFTPVEFLMQMNQGNPIREPEIQLVKELQNKGLNNGVINMLFFFIVRKGKGLDHRVVRLIADDWISKNVTTTAKAYSLAKKVTPLKDGLSH